MDVSAHLGAGHAPATKHLFTGRKPVCSEIKFPVQLAALVFLGGAGPCVNSGAGLSGLTQHALTLQIRDTGMLLNVLNMLALTPGGGSNTKMRPARSRFTGT